MFAPGPIPGLLGRPHLDPRRRGLLALAASRDADDRAHADAWRRRRLRQRWRRHRGEEAARERYREGLIGAFAAGDAEGLLPGAARRALGDHERHLLDVVPDRHQRGAGLQGSPAAAHLPTEEGDAETSSEPGFLTRMGRRAAVGMKMTEEGGLNYLRHIYGAGNVAQDNIGDIYVRELGKEWERFNPQGTDPGDFAEWLAPALVEGAPTLLAGTNPLTAGAAGVAGAAARQAMAELIPGDEDLSLGHRALHGAGSGLLAGGTQAGVNLLFRGIDRARPHNIIARRARKQLTSPQGYAGQIAERESGIPLSFGELTGNRLYRMIEGVLRQHPATAAAYESFAQTQLGAATRRLAEIMDRMGKPGYGALGTGTVVKETFDATVRRLIAARRLQADGDYGLVRRLAGFRPIVRTDALRTEILKTIDDFDVPGGQRIVGQAKALLKELGEGTTVHIDRATKMRSAYADAARGTGRVFQDIDSAQNRMLAGRLRDAATKDIESSADDLGPEMADALRAANANYARMSQIIKAVEESVLGRLLGGRYQRAPEAIGDAFGRMRPSEVRAATQILDASDAGAMQAVRRHVMEMWLDRAIPPPTEAIPAGVPLSPGKFVASLPDREYLDAMFGDRAARDIRYVAEALQRIADKAGMAGSRTMPSYLVWDTMKGVFTLDPVKLGRTATVVIGPRKLARAMTTMEGRTALISLTRTKVAMKKALALVGYLVGGEKKDELVSSAARARPAATGTPR